MPTMTLGGSDVDEEGRAEQPQVAIVCGRWSGCLNVQKKWTDEG